MTIFGFTITRDKPFNDRDQRWFMRGYEAGWAQAMVKAEEAIRAHMKNTVVLRTSPELADKLKAEKEVAV